MQGESSNPQKGDKSSRGVGGDGDKTPKGNGGNGEKPPLTPPFSSPPSSPPSSPSSYSTTTSSPTPPHSPKGHDKNPLLKLETKFELLMYNGVVNAKILDNWVLQLEVYCRIQRVKDDDTKIHLASLRLEGVVLVWWEAKTQEDMKKHRKVLTSWNDFVDALRIQFYPL